MNINSRKILEDLYSKTGLSTLPAVQKYIRSLFTDHVVAFDIENEGIFDLDFFTEAKCIASSDDVRLSFGAVASDMKITITDNELREHDVYISYQGQQKLNIMRASFPHTPLLDRQYTSLDEIVKTFKNHVNNLSGYFSELEKIDLYCTVMEPVRPTARDDYRRILLDDRTWLHVEVTADGLASNIHLIGQKEEWHDKLQDGLLKWDHDSSIVDNIKTIFDFSSFPVSTSSNNVLEESGPQVVEAAACGICLCTELPDQQGVPQPLCQNTTCGVHFHRSCLYQWLVACAGGRPPAFGMAYGSCPACLEPVTCSEKTN